MVLFSFMYKVFSTFLAVKFLKGEPGPDLRPGRCVFIGSVPTRHGLGVPPLYKLMALEGSFFPFIYKVLSGFLSGIFISLLKYRLCSLNPSISLYFVLLPSISKHDQFLRLFYLLRILYVDLHIVLS